MNQEILETTIKELAMKIANLEIENAQYRATISKLQNQDQKENEIAMIPPQSEGDS